MTAKYNYKQRLVVARFRVTLLYMPLGGIQAEAG